VSFFSAAAEWRQFFTCESTANGKLNGELKILTEQMGFPDFLWWVLSLYSLWLDHRGRKWKIDGERVPSVRSCADRGKTSGCSEIMV